MLLCSLLLLSAQMSLIVDWSIRLWIKHLTELSDIIYTIYKNIDDGQEPGEEESTMIAKFLTKEKVLDTLIEDAKDTIKQLQTYTN